MNDKPIISKYKEIVSKYASMDFGCMCDECKQTRSELLKLHSELSLLQEQQDINTPLKNITPNAFTMTEKIEEWSDIREKLIKFEAWRRVDNATHIKEYEFAEQIIDEYLKARG